MRTTPAALVIVVAAILAPRDARAYSVLAHQSNIDALWDAQIRPLLLDDRRPSSSYPNVTANCPGSAREVIRFSLS